MLLLHPPQDVDDRFVLLFEMLHDGLHFLRGFGVNHVVLLSHQAILGRQPILRLHDNWCGLGSPEAEREVEQDERVGVLVAHPSHDVESDPGGQNDRLDDHECPTTHHNRKLVGDPLARCQCLHQHPVNVDQRADGCAAGASAPTYRRHWCNS